MESIGSRIRSAREAKGISLEQAQKETKISARILSAIEADRAQEIISGPVYIKSFIKKYADYLGLDGVSLAESFSGGRPELKEQISVLSRDAGSPHFPFKKVVYAAVIALLLFLGIRLIFFLGSKAATFFKSRPKVEKSVTKPKVAAKPATPSLPQVPRGEGLVLSLNARTDVYLKVKTDGRVMYDGILRKGSEERWEAKESFEISTNKAESLTIDLNGNKVGPLGKGAIKGLRLPK